MVQPFSCVSRTTAYGSHDTVISYVTNTNQDEYIMYVCDVGGQATLIRPAQNSRESTGGICSLEETELDVGWNAHSM